MGLFSFLKKSGKKVEEEKPEMSAEEKKATRLKFLKNEINKLELDIQDMEIQIEEESVRISGKAKTQEIREKAILALGNIEGIATVYDRIEIEEEAPEATFYEVKSGDSLSKIAKEHYGDPMKYTVIFEANKPMLKDPDKIYPGQVLRIPPLEDQ
jgi:nucleoid-associated protein YgaU